MSGKRVLIVESPSKCKTIENILGNDKNIKVLASKGHIKQVVAKKESIQITDTLKIQWENNSNKTETLIKQIKSFNPEEIILATDLDREGEAISWHIKSLLTEKKLGHINTSRMIFNEITPNAIKYALVNLKDIDYNLVNSYITRLTLDFKIGFEITPILWKFLRVFKNQSAGRVQSPTLGLIVTREKEIVNFIPKKYFTHTITFLYNKQKIIGEITKYNKKKLETFTCKNKLETALNSLPKQVVINSIKHKKLTVKPSEPFITSSLQQAASNQLGFTIDKTMQIAQKLYEGVVVNSKPVAFITYMRTDNCSMSKYATDQIVDYLKENFTSEYIPKEKNVFLNKKSNTQESHECIRPVDIKQKPEMLKDIDNDSYKLYDLIWKRSLASQMTSAVFHNITANIEHNKYTIQIKHSYLAFVGFKKIYGQENETQSNFTLKEKDILNIENINIQECETKPPPRYSESRLVGNMEEQGIGRPSTYGHILDTLKKRNYIYVKNKSLVPTDKGIITFYFLYHYFNKYIDYQFTRTMEENLDQICNAKVDYLCFLQQFEKHLTENVNNTSNQTNIIQHISKDVLSLFNTKCSKCNSTHMELQVKFSFFFRCVQCKHIEAINVTKYSYEDAELLISSTFKMLKINNTKIYLPNFYNFQNNDLKFLKTLPIENQEYLARSTSYGFLLENKLDSKKKYFKNLEDFVNQLTLLKIY